MDDDQVHPDDEPASDEDPDSEEDDEEDLDHDELILGNTTDLIISLAKALGNQFLTHLTKLGPSLVRYLDDTHPKSDRVMVIGCLSETLNECEAALPVYFNDFIKIVLKNSKSHDSSLNRNCSYSIGILAEKAGPLFQSVLQECLQALHLMYA